MISHLLGRLASIIAKELLNGQRVVIVRTERVVISGSLYRHKLIYGEFLRKRMNHNPKRGIVHWKAPSRLTWRTIRGMLPHKTPRGAAALARLKVFEGIPAPYDQKKRKVVPDALKVNRMKNFRKYCLLGDLSTQVGWKKQELVEKLEEQRKTKSHKYYERRLLKIKNTRKAHDLPELKQVKEKLAKFGY